MDTGGEDILVLLQSAFVVPFEAAIDRLTPRLSPPRPRLTASAPISSSRSATGTTLLTRPFAERHHEQCASQFPSPPRHEQQRREEHGPMLRCWSPLAGRRDQLEDLCWKDHRCILQLMEDLLV